MHAAENEAAFPLDTGTLGHLPGRMIFGGLEHGRDLTLLFSRPYKPAVAAAAKGQHQGIQQDGFAGPGLARQDRHSGTEPQVQFFDQDNVADDQLGEHQRRPGDGVR